MAIITPELLAAMTVGFRRDFQQGLGSAESAWREVATRVPSTARSTTYGWLGQFPQLQEWVGDRKIKSMAAHGYQIENKLWESSVGVQRTDIEDDSIGVYSPLFLEMGRAVSSHTDELVFSLLKNGGSELCFDGQNFFDNEHPVYPSVDGTGSPILVANQDIPPTDAGPAWYLLDVSRSLKPLIFQERVQPELQAMTDNGDEAVFMRDEYRYGVRTRSNVGFGFWQMAYKSQQQLSATSYAKARAAMMSLKADGGRPLAIRPTLLVVPPSLEQQALEILQAERLGNGATNVYRGTAKPLITPWVA